MSRKIFDYTDIGHDKPNSVIWMLTNGYLDKVLATQERSHERLFGLIESENRWRGRYEPDTGLCSIIPPLSWTENHPSQAILDTLASAFAVTEFHFFSQYGHEKFSPNPKGQGF